MSDQINKNPQNASEKPAKAKKNKYPKASIKWSPNPPVIQEDKIISSVAREKNIWGFIPTYESEECHMGCIMSGEYGRRWLKEREAFEKDTYTKEKYVRSSDTSFNRKFVQKFMSYKKPTKCSWLESRFRDWSKLSKDEIFTIKLRETRYRVSKDCLKAEKPENNKKSNKKESKKCTCQKQPPDVQKEKVKCTCIKK